MNAPFSGYQLITGTAAEQLLHDVAAQLRGGEVIPYLGPGLIEATAPGVPTSPEALAAFFASKVALPKRAKGNAWASAQHIESTKHRSSVSVLMTEAFAPAVPATKLHHHLASLSLPMIVDTWYDGAARTAMPTSTTWGEVQGITRAGVREDRWFRFYDADGTEVGKETAGEWTTLLYKPHGSVTPAKNYLISDADYVEVLTEIDIQTPIPELVKTRRTARHFLFLGCRFHDQMLRTYARQIMKRSSDMHWAIIDPGQVTRNELRFMTLQGIQPIALPLDTAIDILLA